MKDVLTLEKMCTKQKNNDKRSKMYKKLTTICFYLKINGLQRETRNRNSMYIKDVATLEKICTKPKIMRD